MAESKRTRRLNDTATDWAQFYLAQRAALSAYAHTLTGNAADAADLVQDVLVRFVERGRPPSIARTQVFRALRNLAIDRFRVRQSRKTHASPDVPAACTDQQTTASAQSAAESDAVRRALGTLSPQQRETIVLRIYSELTFAEIADVLARPLGTVSSDYSRGLAELRAALQPEVCHAR